MSEAPSFEPAFSRPSAQRAVVLGAAGVVAAVGAVAVGLWAHYGTAIFFEMALAGLQACF